MTEASPDFVSSYLPDIRAVLQGWVGRGLVEAPVVVVAGDRVQVRLDGPTGNQIILAYYDAEDDWIRLVSAIDELTEAPADLEGLLRGGVLPPPLRFCTLNGWIAVRADALRREVAEGHFRIVFEAMASALPEIHRRWGGAKRSRIRFTSG